MNLRRWVLLEGDRNTLAFALVGAVFVLLFTAGVFGWLDHGRPGAVDTVAGGLVPGLFAFLSIVLAINQLVLSQEFGSAAEIRERVARVRAFRRDVEETAEEAPSPVVPAAFLNLIVDAIGDEAQRLADRGSHQEAQPADQLERLGEAVEAETQRARTQLSDRNTGRVSAILSVLGFEDAVHLHEARRILDEHRDELAAETARSLERLVDLLAMFSVARTHFRTTYTQRVLARLSRLLLYVGVPAIGAAFVLGLLPETLGPELRVLVVSILLALAFAPVAVLSSYVLRIASVSERTLAAGPFESRPE